MDDITGKISVILNGDLLTIGTYNGLQIWSKPGVKVIHNQFDPSSTKFKAIKVAEQADMILDPELLMFVNEGALPGSMWQNSKSTKRNAQIKRIVQHLLNRDSRFIVRLASGWEGNTHASSTPAETEAALAQIQRSSGLSGPTDEASDIRHGEEIDTRNGPSREQSDSTMGTPRATNMNTPLRLPTSPTNNAQGTLQTGSPDKSMPCIDQAMAQQPQEPPVAGKGSPNDPTDGLSANPDMVIAQEQHDVDGMDDEAEASQLEKKKLALERRELEWEEAELARRKWQKI
ncbi:hypothetical protein LTR56_001965 [Elasticomyces elasticus]|nr:hypothetical protein LTR22_011551 [Elasticomyces elasticus]KAK3658109.1 hypothetical protein LTR56_001965 [Elasticomyces elasticus]KAK5749120.1 hypothetical protein LTS12_020815 [Elasticomyces elasticus]